MKYIFCFGGIQTYRRFYFSRRLFAKHHTLTSWCRIFSSRSRSCKVRILSISKFFLFIVVILTSILLKTAFWQNFKSSFSLSHNKHGEKNKSGNRPVKGAKKTKCYKRLIYKQFFQVSGLYGPQFLSYLPKRFTHLCSFVWRLHICVEFWYTNMAAGNQQNHLEFTFSTKALFFTRALAYVHINTSCITRKG